MKIKQYIVVTFALGLTSMTCFSQPPSSEAEYQRQLEMAAQRQKKQLEQQPSSEAEYQRQLEMAAQRRKRRLEQQRQNDIAREERARQALNDELSGDLNAKRLQIDEFIERIWPLSRRGDERALEWLIRAAEEGSVEAQYYLGYNYANGFGVDVELTQAEYWLVSSARGGSSKAKTALKNSLSYSDEELEIEVVIKPKCTDFGFNSGTDAHANCVMELKIAEDALKQARILHEEINQSIIDSAAEAEARTSAARRYELARQREREAIERQRAASRALLGIGAGLFNSGQPSSSGGMLKTCYYSVGGQTVPYPVSSASICPPSRDFGGIAGFLQ
jgi:hypothetical protein